MVTWRRPLAEINFFGLDFPRQITLRRVSSGGSPYAVTRGVGVPKIPLEYLDSVFYCYENEEDARNGEDAGGSGFLASIPSPSFPQQVIYTYAITNWHVACDTGCSVVRLNNKDGTTDIFPYGPEDWTFSTKYDIAALQIPVDTGKSGVLVNLADTSIIPDDINEKRLRLGVGDNVFMLGRFIDHDGVSINKPAARFGNISVMPAPIAQSNGARADSFCIDMHSRTGFSGSPVFVYRSIGDDLDYTAGTGQVSDRSFLKFLGIHWGQFPEYWDLVEGNDQAEANKLTRDSGFVRGVSGMTLVLPAWSILEVLNLLKLHQRREEEEKLLGQYVREHGLPAMAEYPKISLDWLKGVEGES